MAGYILRNFKLLANSALAYDVGILASPMVAQMVNLVIKVRSVKEKSNNAIFGTAPKAIIKRYV